MGYGVSTGLIGVLQVIDNQNPLEIGKTLDGKILIFNLLNLELKKFNLKAEITNKQINNLSQYEDFYNHKEYSKREFEINTINAKDFRKLYKEQPDKILLIDVREKAEFCNSSIEGSISIPLSNLEDKVHIEFFKKQSLIKEVFLLCQLGRRSEKHQFYLNSKSNQDLLRRMKKLINKIKIDYFLLR